MKIFAVGMFALLGLAACSDDTDAQDLGTPDLAVSVDAAADLATIDGGTTDAADASLVDASVPADQATPTPDLVMAMH